MIAIYHYGEIISNVFSSHYAFIKNFQNTPSLVMTGHYFKNCDLLFSFCAITGKNKVDQTS